ncbi:MAG: class II aldolase/adducin family protein [Candidatus Eisenbacteria bacterium]|nr:class II aldolase/adducin family protein [Candidatus Eisenbacteria bacterium]
MTRHAEGVIRFALEHDARVLEPRLHAEIVSTLAAWREVLARLDLVGRDPARYEGLGYGNVSARLGPFGDVGRGRRRFVVSGTQTGGLPALTLDQVCVVERYDVARGEVWSAGPVRPSSESLTHAALYDIAPTARVVLHAHAPEIWRHARSLAIPVTREAAANGTADMALEVQRLYRESTLSGTGILAMAGHEDGVIAFGASAEEAGAILVRQLARALTLGRRAP